MTANPLGWSTTSGSNTSVEGVDISEGMSPAGVNNAMRATMTGVKELANILTGLTTSGGEADVQTYASGMGLSAYAAGQAFVFKAGYTNTGALTLDVDTIGAKAVTRNDGAALAAGDVTAGGLYMVAYEAVTGDFHLLNPGIGGYLANISEDTTPTLGGHLAGGGYDVTGLGTLSMTEQATANDDTGGDGQLWVKTATPNVLYYTDDAGTDFQVATLTGTETLTNKTFDLTDNTLAGTLAELSTAISDATVASTAGSETLTNKTLTSAVLNTGVSGTAVLDEDTMSSDSNTQLATQQSIKAYVDAAGAVVLLASGTISDDATLPFVLTAHTAYRKLVLELVNFTPATDEKHLRLLSSTDGGSSYDEGSADYKWVGQYADSFAGTITTENGDGVAYMRASPDLGSATGETTNITITLTGMSAAKYTQFQAVGHGMDHARDIVQWTYSGMRDATTDVDAISLEMEDGNCESGTYALYGYK